MDGINLHRLQVFRTVFETDSVSAAARAMRLSQPTISRHLQIFEDELNLTLFRNVAGRLEPTWEAQRLYAESGGLFERLGQVAQSVDSIRRGQHEALRIMATTALAHSVLPEALGQLHRDFPDLEIVVDGGRQSNQLPALHEGSVDLAVGGAWDGRPELRQWTIGHMPLVAVLPDDHPRASEDAFDLAWLQGADFVTHNVHAPLGARVEAELKRRNIQPRRSLTALSIPFAVGLARGARMCTVVDRLSVPALKGSRMRVLPLSEPIGLELAVAQLADRPERSPVTALIAAMRRVYADTVAQPLN
ncbi:LysR family transcriptional regulator [Pseudooceanicola nitratireducens]|uniref:LysR family transcriptional regulator n=1 Tax=Pseudooceanicola nitratireducens TaxID=517719 RepID=UPI001C9669C0|nr:LysR family transcriptional regulator [Pseudooceanicola nitratireducens]MBY6158146.1 LysR family transcriptional regulator [Pseudooceanicola nitratireducens]